MGFFSNVKSAFGFGAIGGAFGADDGTAANTVSSQPAGNLGPNTQNQIGSAVGAAAGTAAGAAARGVYAAYGAELRAAAGPLGVIAGGLVGYGVGYGVGYATSYGVGAIVNNYGTIKQTIIQDLSQYGNNLNSFSYQCFSADVEISMPTNSSVKTKDIEPGDEVFAFNSRNGNIASELIVARVNRVFRSITTEWLILSSGVTVTPGHRFLNEIGKFESISSIISRSGMIVTDRGNLEYVSAERIIYGDSTKHLYEEAEELQYLTVGNIVFEPQTRRGWRTYKFEVEQAHTYIAAGHRVHNDSIGDYNSLAGDLAADVHNWSRMLVQMEIISSSVLDAPYEIGSLS